MSKADWGIAPEDAEFYAYGLFRKHGGTWHPNLTVPGGEWRKSSRMESFFVDVRDYERRPSDWPEEARIDIIGTNGNDGQVYETVTIDDTVYRHNENGMYALYLKN